MNQQQYSWQPEKNKNEEIDELWTESEVAEARFQWKILILFGSVLLKIHSLQTFEIKGCQENWVNKEESLVQSRPGKILSTQHRVSKSYWYFRAASREGLNIIKYNLSIFPDFEDFTTLHIPYPRRPPKVRPCQVVKSPKSGKKKSLINSIW